MDQMYEIPVKAEGEDRLSVGDWVEIFEAHGEGEGTSPIVVKSMRVEGQVLVFEKMDGRHPGTKALSPQGGEVIYIDRLPGRTRFSIRPQPKAA